MDRQTRHFGFPVLERARMQTAPRLKEEHIEARVMFGRENMDRDWRTVGRLRRNADEPSESVPVVFARPGISLGVEPMLRSRRFLEVCKEDF